MSRSNDNQSEQITPYSGITEAQLVQIDVAIGSRVRLRRVLLGLTQTAVAMMMNLPFQQLQEYELGTSRISSSRLYQLALILDVPVSFFFETAGNGIVSDHRQEADVFPKDVDLGHVLNRSETIELIRAYYGISGEPQRHATLTLLKSFSQLAPSGSST
jgi:transcriptional regulator with XRE-family HTH domain